MSIIARRMVWWPLESKFCITGGGHAFQFCSVLANFAWLRSIRLMLGLGANLEAVCLSMGNTSKKCVLLFRLGKGEE